MPAGSVSYSVPGGRWKRTDSVSEAIDKRRIGKLDPGCRWSRGDAFQVRFARKGVERPEADSIDAVLRLFWVYRKFHDLPSYRPGGAAEDVFWLQRFLERLKPDANSYVWTLQEQSRVPPHGAFLFMGRLAGLAGCARCGRAPP